ncbi:MAG: hypothetical protein AB8B69_20865, partial [Chitinophagales bacterium]
MKESMVLLFLCLTLFSQSISAQNLLQNGDFETYTSLPVNQLDFEVAVPWKRVIRSPDFEHLLAGNYSPSKGLPFSGQGFAAHGKTSNGMAEALGQDISANPILEGKT